MSPQVKSLLNCTPISSEAAMALFFMTDGFHSSRTDQGNPSFGQNPHEIGAFSASLEKALETDSHQPEAMKSSGLLQHISLSPLSKWSLLGILTGQSWQAGLGWRPSQNGPS